MKNKIYNLKTVSFRKIPLFEIETGENEKIKRFVAIINIEELKNLDFPQETNLRDIKERGSVFTSIKDSLETMDIFHILNRGIFLSVKNVRHDSDKKELILNFGDSKKEKALYGIVDGGHTYHIIKNYLKNDKIENRLINIEIFTGLEDQIADFVEARNSSTAVDNKTMINLRNEFNIIKNALKNEVYWDNIAYKQNEKKDIDIREILAIMYSFRIDLYEPFNTQKHPIQSYSGKEYCVTQFEEAIKDENTSYIKLLNILPKILELADYIKAKIPIIWNNNKGNWKNTKLNIKSNSKTFLFDSNLYKDENTPYAPRPFWLPVLASLRVLLTEKENGVYQFTTQDPKVFLDEILENIIEILKREYEKGRTLSSMGKDKNIWQNIYTTVLLKAVSKGYVKLN